MIIFKSTGKEALTILDRAEAEVEWSYPMDIAAALDVAKQAITERILRIKDTKCRFPFGIVIKPDGVNDLDACFYEDKKIYTNCTVTVRKCIKCGNYDTSWERTPETEVIECETIFGDK